MPRSAGVPAIYPVPMSPSASIVLPSGSGGPPSQCVAGLHELSAPGMYSTSVTTGLVGSYSTFSPLPLKNKWRLFSSTLIHPCERLPVKKQNALCCPDFPLALRACAQGPAADRPAVLLCCLRDVASAVHAAPAGGPDCPLSSAKVQRKTIHSLGLQRKVVSFLSCAAPREPEKRVPEAPLMLVSAAFQNCSCGVPGAFLAVSCVVARTR